MAKFDDTPESTVHKYVLTTGEQTIEIPHPAELLCAHEQHGQIMLWARVLVPSATAPRKLNVVGTGWGGAHGRYVGSAFVGDFVWHVFDMGEASL